MNIAEFIFTSIKQKLPTINWSLGSALRELIATPIVTITDIASEALVKQSEALSIDAYIEEPEKYTNEINTLFKSLQLKSETAISTTGKVTIITSSENPSPVYKNTTFYYNNIPVSVAADTYPSIVNTDNNSSFTQLYQLGYKSYAFEVPIISSDINIYLTEGTSLIWNEAPDDIYAITVTTPLSGGRMSMTLLEKALKIKDYISPNTITLSAGMTKLLREKLPDIVVDAAFAQDIVSDGRSYLYVKTKKAPSYYKYTVTGKLTESGLYEVCATIPGILNIINAYKGHTNVNIRQIQIQNNTVYCMLEYNSSTLTEEFTLDVYGLPDASVIQNFLDGFLIGSPYNIEVKAPDSFDVGIEFVYTGNELNNTDINRICEIIQNTTMNIMFSDTYLNNILSTYGAKLKDSAIYTVNNIDGLCYKQRVSPFIYSKKYKYFALYTGINKIKATYVQ